LRNPLRHRRVAGAGNERRQQQDLKGACFHAVDSGRAKWIVQKKFKQRRLRPDT
jgi:hypothetical protein